MASFTEQATLRVVDQSSANLRKINAELKKLFATARSLKSMKVNIAVNATGVKTATAEIRRLNTELTRLKASARAVRVNVNASGITAATRQLAQLRAQAARPINIRTTQTATRQPPGRAAAPPRQPPPPRGGGGYGPGYNYGQGSQYMHRYGRGGRGPPALGAALIQGAGAAGGALMNVAGSATRAALALGAVGAAGVAIKGGQAVVASEDARTRVRQAGFTEAQTDLFAEMARRAQDQYKRVPAADVLNASVEQLSSLRAAGATPAEYQESLNRVARNSQILANTYKDPKKGAEGARQLERLSQIMGEGVDAGKIREIHEQAIRAVVATGGEISIEEGVRTVQQLGSSIARTLSAKSLRDIMMVRDEGGRASTAEWRMAVQEVTRGDMNKKDRRAMAAQGLRTKDLGTRPELGEEAAKDLVKFVGDRIEPILQRGGVADKSAAYIAAYLDEKVGYSQASARGIADIVVSRRSKEYRRAVDTAERVDLDPALADKTFRGGVERLNASFATASARAFDKMGPAFSDAVKPLEVTMDKAGKAAEQGDFTGAAKILADSTTRLMGGPVGAVMTSMAAANAVKTTLDPTASPIERGASLLVTGSLALGTAAGMIMKAFGKKDEQDTQKEVDTQKLARQQNESRAKELEAQVAAEEQKETPDRALIGRLRAQAGQERLTVDALDKAIGQGETQVSALREERQRIQDEEDAHYKRLEEQAKLGPQTKAPEEKAPLTRKQRIAEERAARLRMRADQRQLALQERAQRAEQKRPITPAAWPKVGAFATLPPVPDKVSGVPEFARASTEFAGAVPKFAATVTAAPPAQTVTQQAATAPPSKVEVTKTVAPTTPTPVQAVAAPAAAPAPATAALAAPAAPTLDIGALSAAATSISAAGTDIAGAAPTYSAAGTAMAAAGPALASATAALAAAMAAQAAKPVEPAVPPGGAPPEMGAAVLAEAAGLFSSATAAFTAGLASGATAISAAGTMLSTGLATGAAAIGASGATLSASMAAGAASLTAGIASGASAIAASASTFSAVFGQAAASLTAGGAAAGAALQAGGSAAAAAISSGAAAAGAAYGSAAAAQIRSAVANVSISVQHSGSAAAPVGASAP